MMMAMTTISSSMVNPSMRKMRRRLESVARTRVGVIADFTSDANFLPVSIFCVIHRDALRKGIDVENIFAAPRGRGRIVRDGAQAPFGAAGHGIDGNFAQVANELLGLRLRGARSAGASCVRANLNAFHESFQIRRIIFGALLGDN